MAGATNRAFKAAGIPKKAQAQIRVHAGGRLTLKAAVDVAAKHGIPLPDKVHARMAARAAEGRKAALREASARRGANVARALGDAAKIAMQRRRAAGLDATAKRGKDATMDAPLRKVSEGRYEGTIGSTPVRVIRSTVGENRYGERSKAVEWKVHGGGRVITEGHGTMSGAVSAAKRALGVEEKLSARLTANQANVLALAKEGRADTSHLGTLKALRKLGLLTYSHKTFRRPHGRGVDSVETVVRLTPAGEAAFK